MNPAELFSHESNPLRLAPGDVLFKTGDSGDAMFVLLQGTMDVFVEDQLVGQSHRGDIIGEMALIDQSPRSATLVAHEDAILVKLDAPRFHRLIQQNTYFALHVMKVLADRIRRTDSLRAHAPKS